jgi:uncharacterized protein YggE
VNEHRISVLGSAIGELEPDRVRWSLSVREVDQHPSAAFKRCTERLRTLVAALGDAELTTSDVSVEDEWHTHGHKPTGRHIAAGSISAIAPLAGAGELAAAAMAAGADGLHGPRAVYPDDTERREALYGAAVSNARVIAQQMADAAGRTLGRAISIRDRRADEGDGFLRASAASGGGERDEGPPVLTRPQRLSVAVAVVFELVD